MNPLPALGCSGAIFGLLGGLGAFYWTHRGVLRKEHRRPRTGNKTIPSGC